MISSANFSRRSFSCSDKYDVLISFLIQNWRKGTFAEGRAKRPSKQAAF
jgi:hypothetical protein